MCHGPGHEDTQDEGGMVQLSGPSSAQEPSRSRAGLRGTWGQPEEGMGRAQPPPGESMHRTS